jgi:EAL domain-containing protein (putative c-di-GMP-specific phosphodiesterase class I)
MFGEQMLELQKIIHDVTDPIVVLRRVVEQALHAVPHADGAAVELLRDGHFDYVCTGGRLEQQLGLRLPVAASIAGLALTTGETQCCADSELDKRVNLAACRTVGARSLICVPLRRGDEPIGVLKVTSSQPLAFDDADVEILTGLAEFITVSISAAADIARAATAARDWNSAEFVANVLSPGIFQDHATRRRIKRVLADDDFAIAVQPIVRLDSGALVGAEALARFPSPPVQGPDRWFAEAYAAGLGAQLELAAARKAINLLDELPPHAYLSVNIGPEVLATTEFMDLVRSADAERLVIELTEHFAVEDYERLRAALCGLRRAGARLAIDDTGAGFASLAHILKLSPEIIKLDRGLARGIDADPVRRALAAALVDFAHQTGAQVVAEGLETDAELATVRELGIHLGQGYLLGKPGPTSALATPTSQYVA